MKDMLNSDTAKQWNARVANMAQHNAKRLGKEREWAMQSAQAKAAMRGDQHMKE